MNELYGFLSQLAEFKARTKYLLNAYPYEIRMTAPSMKEFADEFCTSSIGYGTEAAAVNNIVGIPIVQSSVVPDHEAWIFYRDNTTPLGFRIERIRWGEPKSPLAGAVDK